MKGAEILVNALLDEGVDTVFGYPGGAIIDIYDALYDHKEIKHILTAHEQGAAHAADGYARVSGRVGVCLATSGPGATNLVTGIAAAYMDSVPVVAITGNVSTKKLGKDSFQEVDIAGITMPVTKHNFIIKNAKDIRPTIRRAFEIARSGRPGPVLVDITTDAISSETDEYSVDAVYVRNFDNFTEADLKKAAKLINRAKRPLIYAGGGAALSGAQYELLQLSKTCDAVICDSLMGKGVVPGTDERYLGMTGIHGTKAANTAVDECDLCIAVGVRFSDRAMREKNCFSENAKMIHIDIDPAEIDKNVHADVALTGDAKHVLKALLPLVKENVHKTWIKRMTALKRCAIMPVAKGSFDAASVVTVLYKVTKGDAYISTEVGSHQMISANTYVFSDPRHLITSGGLGAMGYGLPAAIGASIALKNKPVINLAGDGCFRMNMAELATASRYSVPVIEIVFNNRSLGLVRELQDMYCNGRHSCTDLIDNCDFVKVAEGLGCKGYRASTLKEFESSLKKALKEKKPAVIDCRIE